MSLEEIKADTAAYVERRTTVEHMYQDAMQGERPTPSDVSKERLELAVMGDPRTGERVPLTYGADPAEAAQLFHEFRDELQAVFDSEGITDAVVVQLGSGTSGWSTAPGKTGKAWTPASDVDFAIFSDQALEQARLLDVPINPKNQLGGKYTTLKNDAGARGFYETPLGRKLDGLARRWNERVYGQASAKEGFDFKLNLGDQPFTSAVPVVQMEIPVPLTTARSGSTRAIPIKGRSTYFGVPVEPPAMADRLPTKAVGRREFHITVLSPPEWAALTLEEQARLAQGAEISGVPRGRGIVRKEIGNMGGFQMTIEWPEAQAFRQSVRSGDGASLPDKDLHISLNGGIGDAILARDTASDIVGK